MAEPTNAQRIAAKLTEAQRIVLPLFPTHDGWFQRADDLRPARWEPRIGALDQRRVRAPLREGTLLVSVDPSRPPGAGRGPRDKGGAPWVTSACHGCATMRA